MLAYLVYTYDGLDKSVITGFAAVQAAEGLVFVCDALFRARPVKKIVSKSG